MVPSPLQHSSARVLEFDQFRDLLAAYVSSPLGKARVAELVPSADRAWIAQQQQLAAETRKFLSAGGRLEFSGLSRPSPRAASSAGETHGCSPR